MYQPEYTQFLSDRDRYHVRIKVENGALVRFVLQFETLLDQEWRQIRRFDNCHDDEQDGDPHLHIFYQSGKERWEPLCGNPNDVFQEGLAEMKKDWEKWKEYYFAN